MKQINLEQLYLENKEGQSVESIFNSGFLMAGSIAAIIAGALTDNELSGFLMAGGIATLPVTVAGLYANVKRYLGLEKNLETQI